MTSEVLTWKTTKITDFLDLPIRLVWYKFIDVSEENAASNFRISLFYPEERSSMFFQKVGKYLLDYMASQPVRLQSS
jgi:hypothetical protein